MSNEMIEHEGLTKEVQTQPLGHKLPMALGQWEANEEQLSILFTPINEELVELRYDGTVYIPWMEYARRLRDAFGVSWAMLPDKDPYVKGNYVLWPFWLIIKGQKVAYAVGAHEYNPKNPRMTWDDSLEAAQSNALMRCCKHIGMFLELWQPEFIRNWKAKYVKNNKKVGTENKPDPKPYNRRPQPEQKTEVDAPNQDEYSANFERIVELLSLLANGDKDKMQAIFTGLSTAKDGNGEPKTKVSQLTITEQTELIERLEYEKEETQDESSYELPF